MPEEVLFKTESMQTRGDVAALFRTVADKLDGGEPITLSAGNDSITMDPPGQFTFEVKAERETTRGSTDGELSVEFELEWNERDSGSDGDSGLQIE
ncbi:amphi-Trp domain-containing protein [Haloarchaeobius sp. HRN-SO-5]|uniref:amphi-Trp domain-containing protein n=1 Tax=Haloarchaeobius sp. HRN-SO-5 TaxID=3446118 RepID=UPI003EB9013F